MKFVNKANLNAGLKNIQSIPFDHCIINDFFKEDIALKLADEFDDYLSEKWYIYRNEIENKKTNNKWSDFPGTTYAVFAYLNSPEFIHSLSDAFKAELYPDPGLHGGGWHIHGKGGNLNPHLDYSKHPKIGMQRKLNIIIYLSKDLKPEHGGALGLYSNENHSKPGRLIKEVYPSFNRAIIFDTTQNSWHGMSTPLNVPDEVYRKSLAVYYLQEFQGKADERTRALFAPRENQINDNTVMETIRMRSDEKMFHKVYIK